MLKNNKGITLIALVITIIVLLILAGVSIAMVTGQNGILNQASRAGAETQVAEAREMAGLDVSTLISDYYEQKYVKNNTTVRGQEVNEYVEEQLPSKANATYYSVSGSTITLKPLKQDGTQVKGNIQTDGSIEWDDLKTTGGGSGNNTNNENSGG